MGVRGRGLHACDHCVGELGRCGVERWELEVLLLAEVHADERVQAIRQLLERVDVMPVGAHWISDVVAGYLIGLLWLIAALLIGLPRADRDHGADRGRSA